LFGACRKWPFIFQNKGNLKVTSRKYRPKVVHERGILGKSKHIFGRLGTTRKFCGEKGVSTLVFGGESNVKVNQSVR